MHSQHTTVEREAVGGRPDSGGLAGAPPALAAAAPAAALGTDSRKQAKERRRLMWGRWERACELLPAERIVDCRQYASFSRLEAGRAPSIVKGESGHRFAGVCRCRSIWGCALCAGHESEQRRQALELAVERWRNQGKGTLLFTFTFPHTAGDSLLAQVDAFSAAQVRMFGQRRVKELLGDYGIEHHVRALEVTVGPKSGWHTHRHDLAFTAATLTAEQAEVLAEELAIEWALSCLVCGLVGGEEQFVALLQHGVQVAVGYADVEEYIEKHGHEPRWSLAAEVAKGASKTGRSRAGLRFTPFQLLDAMNDAACAVPGWRLEAWFREYYRVFKGRHQLTWSKGAKEALLYVELDPEAEDEAPELVEFTWPEWIATRRARAQCTVLEACDDSGLVGYLRVVGELVERMMERGQMERSRLWCGLDGRWRFTEDGAEHPPARPPDYDDDSVPPLNRLSDGPWPALPEPEPPDLSDYGITEDWF